MKKQQLVDRIKAVERTIRSSKREWLLDNRRLIDSHLTEVRDTLPGSVKRLGARADSLAQELAAVGGEPLSLADVRTFLQERQRETPLRLQELWALDPLIRLALLERICSGLQERDDSESSQVALESLRTVGAENWRELVEACLMFEATLHLDPAGVYSRMDFATRDRYRREIERLARRSRNSEDEVARLVVGLAQSAPVDDPRLSHIGYYLIGKGRGQAEKLCKSRVGLVQQFRRVTKRLPNAFYLGGIGLLTLAILRVCAWALGPVPWWGFLLLLLPVSEAAVAVMNQIVPMLLKPEVLPRLDFSSGIPADCTTMVVVPTLLLSEAGVRSLLEDLEVRALANPDPSLTFALLTDFPDSKEPSGDRDHLLSVCVEGIRELNRKNRRRPYYLFHRPREWNGSEAAWMGRERKRGKLIHFNRLLQGETDEFAMKVGDLTILPRVRYVITLDTDTQLPRDAAQKLAGTLAHPLNQARLDPEKRIVVEGYGILQPRVSISVHSATRSLLARIYSGQTGIDPYTTAVSDVYQDLYGEGSYTGKGIYDVAAFQAAVSRRFPVNSLLSHDLIEGSYARTGLVTDVEVIDDYPSHFQAFSKRKHRWTRGDWQIMLWLLPRVPHYGGHWEPNPLPLMSRWKILDNLRRSLLELSLLALLIAGWFALPGSPGNWTLAVVFFLLLPTYTDLLRSMLRTPGWRMWRPYFRDVGGNFLLGHTNVLLLISFVPQQAALMADAIGRAVIRRVVTGSNLLEWESMAQSEQAGGNVVGAFLWMGPAVGLYCMMLLDILSPGETLPVILALAPWLVSPAVAAWLNQPPTPAEQLLEGDRQFLRGIALRTWRFFTDMSIEADSWIVPDNVQEQPPMTVHRTSPTNVGLQITAQLAAKDFGYYTTAEFLVGAERVLAALNRMERDRGHLLNWYDTTTLRKLPPYVVSTVDSGNLAACLLTVKQGALEAANLPAYGAPLLAGLQDHVVVFRETVPSICRTSNLMNTAAQIEGLLTFVPSHFFVWQETLLHARGLFERLHKAWIDAKAAGLCSLHEEHAEADYWIEAAEKRLRGLEQETLLVAPWLSAEFDANIRLHPVSAPFEELFRLFAAIPRWEDLPQHYSRIEDEINRLLSGETPLPHGLAGAVKQLRPRLGEARELAEDWNRRLRNVASACSSYTTAMDFSFLLNPSRKLLSVGWDAASGRIEKSCYDLLASEARLAAFLAVAKGEAPTESWFLLGRTLTNANGERAMLSWTGTMFEYLMPALFQRSYEGGLLRHTLEAAVACQRKYAQRQAVPWGISESAYAVRDAAGQYQYQAFGVPALGLRRGLAGYLVIAPYAAALALAVAPRAAAENLRKMAARLLVGRYGFYEAVDFTPAHLNPGERFHVVRSWMAHHQGMTLLAIVNALHRNVMQERFHADPLVQATELLLQERLPASALAVEENTALAG